eukprot:Phypoly_transcript_15294.p1 GENE.Phypoly_transcript_15294~~Phypoly_transcript_15294.p1  ORF type:complete len:229 (+),score=30.72 Phypoly_transcript_15294:195-881(+)
MNFLLIGEPGRGKSSFITTVASAFWDEIVSFADVSPDGYETKTTTYGCYKNLTKQACQPVVLFDTKGLGDDWHAEIIEACVAGKMKPNTPFTKKSITGKSDTTIKIHGIVFVDNANNHYEPRIRRNLGESIRTVATNANIPIGVVLTRADALEKTLAGQELAERIKAQHVNFFNTDLCIFVNNYSHESQPLTSTNGQVLDFIRTMQQRALQPFQKYEEEEVRKGCVIV